MEVPTASSITSWLSASVCERWRQIGEHPAAVDWRHLMDDMGLDGCSETGIAKAIFVFEINTVECVLNQGADWAQVQRGVVDLVSRGWRVNVLTPLDALGSAHSQLSGLAASVQGWWPSESGDVHFAGVELA